MTPVFFDNLVRPDARRVVAAACLVFLAACSDAPTEQAIVADSAGIRVVDNLAADIPLDWTFTPAFALGGQDEGPESFYSVGESTVGVDAAGNIYVLDGDGHRLVVFDGDGNHLRTHGREGKGPGEISWAFGLTVKPDGTALIEDIGRGAVHGFNPDGTFVETDGELVPNNRQVWSADGFFSAIRTTESDDEMLYRLLRVVGADTTELARLTTPATAVVELKSCGMMLSGMPKVFSPDIVWDAWLGRAAARVGEAYQVDVYDGVEHVARYRRAIEPIETTRDLVDREMGEGMRMMTSAGVRECDDDEVIEQRGFAPLVPAVRRVKVAPDGRIWVSRGGPRPERTPTDVLEPDGTYIGTLPADAPYPIGFLPDGRMLAAEQDELDVTRLVVYTIEERVTGD